MARKRRRYNRQSLYLGTISTCLYIEIKMEFLLFPNSIRDNYNDLIGIGMFVLLNFAVFCWFSFLSSIIGHHRRQRSRRKRRHSMMDETYIDRARRRRNQRRRRDLMSDLSDEEESEDEENEGLHPAMVNASMPSGLTQAQVDEPFSIGATIPLTTIGDLLEGTEPSQYELEKLKTQIMPIHTTCAYCLTTAEITKLNLCLDCDRLYCNECYDSEKYLCINCTKDIFDYKKYSQQENER